MEFLMEFFLDTADLNEINLYKDFIDGVTTNPSIIAKSGVRDVKTLIKEICQTVHGRVNVEVTSEDYGSMLKEGKQLAQIHENVCVKLPCTFDGFRVCKNLSEEGIAVNMTLCFSMTQALLAAKCGALYVSLFIGRLDDAGQSGISLVNETVDAILRSGECELYVLAASVRSIDHIVQAASAGVDAVTVPPSIFKSCFEHPLTTKGLEIFKRDTEAAK
jgi:transaldolase